MSNEKFDVFISYAREDGEFVATLLSRLGNENILAFADRSIKPGEEWLSRLEYALKESKVILFLVTPNSLRSNWVNAEAGAAWILKKTLIPILLDADHTQLIEFLRSRQTHKLKKSEEIEGVVDILRDIIKPVVTIPQQRDPTEFFNSEIHWSQLLRIGDWSRDDITEEITGTGMHSYLLSRHEHQSTLSLTARIKISNAHPVNKLDAINSGIVLGWTTPNNIRRYFNLLMTGDRLLLELVGGSGGDAYTDYRHVDEGVEFNLLEDTEYIFSIKAQKNDLQVVVRGGHKTLEYRTKLPEPINGRVGMRPWRSTMICSQFNVIS